MDEVDIRLVQRLLMNSRTPYRELADELGLSLQAVHRRIQLMMESGVIQGFTASLNAAYLGAIPVDVIGRCDPPLTEDGLKAIGRNGSVQTVFVGAGGYVTVSGVLRKHSDLEPYLEFLKERGLRDIWTGLFSFGTAGGIKAWEEADEGRLTPLDFRIIEQLRIDSRKPVNDIAEAVGVSAKTITRRLEKMIEGKKLALTIKWYPGMTSGVIMYMIIRLREGADKRAVAADIAKRYTPRIVLLATYSNHPDVLGTVVWSQTLAEQSRLTSELTGESSVKEVVPYSLLKKYEFPSWIDEMISTGAKQERP